MADTTWALCNGKWRRKIVDSVPPPADLIEEIRHRWLDEDTDRCGGDSICEQAMVDIGILYAEIIRLRVADDSASNAVAGSEDAQRGF